MKPLLTLICSLLPILWGCAEREPLSIDPAVAEAVTRSAWRDSIRAGG